MADHSHSHSHARGHGTYQHTHSHGHAGSFREQLHSHGLRATPQRLAILQALETDLDHRHVTAKQVFEMVKDELPGINVTTVYRTLEGLHEVGLVDWLVSGQETVRFALRLEGQRHGHLVCRSCGQVHVLEMGLVGQLAELVQQACLFAVDEDHLTLTGLCQSCRQAHSAGTPKPAPL